ncbi:hypothetical protein IQ244_20285 [Nostoc sp. LEGE 06077]|uniref:hypothetical protein n=1 Tax=Nostoc sp. LEGE 06077 TaxID=915325 RepID=UPI00187F588A|nr:hypothetical protein [Nostoc sp. LEGE 06077]MBE9208838.1 hypothetical protein [Nostoc sp. LEGE 06077]
MGLADIVSDALDSKVVRQQIGERVFKSSFEDKQITQDGENNIINWIWNAGSKLVGFLVSQAGNLISFTITGIWSLFVSTVQFIWNFDWNMSDKSIDQQIQQYWNGILGMLGGTLGNLFGYLACGVVPAATIAVFNEPLGAYVMKNVAEEMAEEFLGNVAGLVKYTFMSGVQSLLLIGFKNLRKWIKGNADFFGRIFGDKTQKAIQAWGAEGSKPWSFAIAVNNAVESISNEGIKNFVEEFLEEAWDGCVEAGYVVANSIDSYLAAEKLKKQILPPMGETKYVEIKPDRSIDDQRIILAGPEEVLKPVIVQTLTNYQMMEDKDIGTFVGSPIDELLRSKPRTISLQVQFFSVKTPPWSKRQGESRLVSATYTIPDIDSAKLDWEKIKLYCGGENGYMYGRYRATGMLDNGRQMAIYASTGDEAEDRMRELLKLSKAGLLKKPTISEDRAEDSTGSYLKQPVRIYPAYFTVLNQYQVPGAPGSSIPITGKRYMRRTDRIDLWVDTKPYDFNERILELLKKPGAEQETT